MVNSILTDRELQATVMMTGFGQTFATTQHRVPFQCRVDLLPRVEQSEAVNVVVTDGNRSANLNLTLSNLVSISSPSLRFCLGVYQCNTTNTCNTQPENDQVNACAMSEVATLTDEAGLVNRGFCLQLLGLLSAGAQQMEERAGFTQLAGG